MMIRGNSIEMIKVFLAIGLACQLNACSNGGTAVNSTTVIGYVSQSTGFPSVLRNSRPYILAEKSQIFPGDVISTDEQSLVRVELTAANEIKLGTHSRLLITQIDQEDGDILVNLNLSSGSLGVRGQSGHPVSYAINTAFAQVATKAQNFWLGYPPGIDSVDVVSLGEEDIIIKNRSGEARLNSPLQASSVTSGSAPTEPRFWSQNKLSETLANHLPTG